MREKTLPGPRHRQKLILLEMFFFEKGFVRALKWFCNLENIFFSPMFKVFEFLKKSLSYNFYSMNFYDQHLFYKKKAILLEFEVSKIILNAISC